MVIADGPDLTERKALLMKNCDCFVIMPGGCGTFDETWECVSNYQARVFTFRAVCLSQKRQNIIIVVIVIMSHIYLLVSI